MKELVVFDVLSNIYFTTDKEKLKDIFSDDCAFDWMFGTICDISPKYSSLEEFYEALGIVVPDVIHEIDKTQRISEIRLSMCLDNGDADAIPYVSTEER